MTIETSAAAAVDYENWYSEDNATFGDRLAGAREAVGMTQKDLAERIGVRLKTLQQWEEDQKEPRANRLQMLAGMLNVSLMWLLTGEGAGLSAPLGDEVRNAEADDLMAELREIRATMGALAEQMGRVEARLRLTLAREAA